MIGRSTIAALGIALLLNSSSVCPPATAQTAQTMSDFEIAARASGTPDFPGLNIVWLTPWGHREDANLWHNIVVHQSEGPAGSAYMNALAQQADPDKRGATIWVETDGTVYWATGEWATPGHVRRGNRDDNRYISNADTYQLVPNNNSLGVEFVGNFPNVRTPPTEAQIDAWRILVKILQTRYGIPTDRIFAHNWVDFKDRRYCEGCSLASMARHTGSDIALRTETEGDAAPTGSIGEVPQDRRTDAPPGTCADRLLKNRRDRRRQKIRDGPLSGTSSRPDKFRPRRATIRDGRKRYRHIGRAAAETNQAHRGRPRKTIPTARTANL